MIRKQCFKPMIVMTSWVKFKIIHDYGSNSLPNYQFINIINKTKMKFWLLFSVSSPFKMEKVLLTFLAFESIFIMIISADHYTFIEY